MKLDHLTESRRKTIGLQLGMLLVRYEAEPHKRNARMTEQYAKSTIEQMITAHIVLSMIGFGCLAVTLSHNIG